jgi:hypothetical protein
MEQTFATDLTTQFWGGGKPQVDASKSPTRAKELKSSLMRHTTEPSFGSRLFAHSPRLPWRAALRGIGDSRLTVLDEECMRIGCGVAHEY